MEDLIPPRFREPFSRLFDESGRILESYVRGQLLIGLIMAVFYAVGFWFLGVPAWAGIAMIAGLLNAIPYVGTILGIVLAGGFTIAGGGGVGTLPPFSAFSSPCKVWKVIILTPRILGGGLICIRWRFFSVCSSAENFSVFSALFSLFRRLPSAKSFSNFCASFIRLRIFITTETFTRRKRRAKISKNASPKPPTPCLPNRKFHIRFPAQNRFSRAVASSSRADARRMRRVDDELRVFLRFLD
jgi:hypothetical protein